MHPRLRPSVAAVLFAFVGSVGCSPFDLSKDRFPCTAPTDCVSGFECNAGFCVAVGTAVPDAGETVDAGEVGPTCSDLTQNGDETGVDCGGSSCGACPTCDDLTQNGDETGVDCGGSKCVACGEPSCTDLAQNGDETGVDCGGSCPMACPTCDDTIQNGDEAGVDCGGSCPNACITCDDSIKNGDESGIDCGGSNCRRCNENETCNSASDCSTVYCNAGTCLNNAASCSAILNAGKSTGDGVYTLDIDGAAGFAPMNAQCDMTTYGGGWTLILNYVHKGETNPALAIRTDSLPIIRSDTLGDDESTNAEAWGHASNALAAALPFDQTMWFGRTSFHRRVIHFETRASEVTSYIKTGIGSMNPSIYETTYGTNLGLYDSALLPFGITERDGTRDAGDRAMTDFPMYGNAGIIGMVNVHWGISGFGERWEVDDYPGRDGSCDACSSTIHRIWARTAPQQ